MRGFKGSEGLQFKMEEETRGAVSPSGASADYRSDKRLGAGKQIRS